MSLHVKSCFARACNSQTLSHMHFKSFKARAQSGVGVSVLLWCQCETCAGLNEPTVMCLRRTMSLRENVFGCVCGAGGPVRRVLFGLPDREQLQRDFSLLMKKDLQEASHRWSFDFSSHKPLLGGDLEWEELPASWVPALYRDCTVGAVLRLEKENIPETPEGSDGEEKTLEKQRHALKRKQTNITDFYQSKRRVVATSRKSGQ